MLGGGDAHRCGTYGSCQLYTNHSLKTKNTHVYVDISLYMYGHGQP